MASPNKNMKEGGDYSQGFEGGTGGYKSFEMKAKNHNNSPFDKNYGTVTPGKMRTFGTKTLEGPKKTDTDPGSGLNYAGGVGSSPAKGIWDKMKSIGKKAMDPLGVLKNALGGGGSDPAAQIKAKMEQMKAAVAAAKAGGAGAAAGGGIGTVFGKAGGGGEVPQHGAESHSGESVNPEKQAMMAQASPENPRGAAGGGKFGRMGSQSGITAAGDPGSGQGPEMI